MNMYLQCSAKGAHSRERTSARPPLGRATALPHGAKSPARASTARACTPRDHTGRLVIHVTPRRTVRRGENFHKSPTKQSERRNARRTSMDLNYVWEHRHAFCRIAGDVSLASLEPLGYVSFYILYSESLSIRILTLACQRRPPGYQLALT